MIFILRYFGIVFLAVSVTAADAKKRDTNQLRGHVNINTVNDAPNNDALRKQVDSSTSASAFRFNVKPQEFSASVMEGYSRCEDLKSDITIALKSLADKSIQGGLTEICYYYDDSDDDYLGGTTSDGMNDAVYASAPESSMSRDNGSGGGLSSFETNNQVAGVDEADLVKANEKYVFVAYSDQIIVTNADGDILIRLDIPQLEVEDKNDGYQNTREIKGLLLNENILTIMTESFNYEIDSPLGNTFTTTFLYEFVEKDSTLILKEQFEILGSYATARMINQTNHMITTNSVDTYNFTGQFYRCNDEFKGLSDEEYEKQAFNIAGETVELHAGKILEAFNFTTSTDDDGSDGDSSSSCNNIVQIFDQNPTDVDALPDMWFNYYRDNILNSFVRITSFDSIDVLTGNRDIERNSAGSFIPQSSWDVTIYASQNTLACAGKGYRREKVTVSDRSGQVVSEYSYILTFTLDTSQAIPSAAGEIEGTMTDQFSMDIYKDHFRTATTSGARYGLFPLEDGHNEWTELEKSKSRVTILQEQDNKLVEVGLVDDLGVDGSLSSVRFLGARGYVSSWQDEDPLYVLDLSDPTNPIRTSSINIMDNLDYMHPINDGNKLLAIGRSYDTDIGLKISLFDVSNSSDLYEEDALVFETNGSSEALDDHRAFRYIAETGMLIIPGYEYNWQNKNFFDGAWLFKINTEEGSISHTGSVIHAGVDEMTNWYCWDSSSLPSRSMVFNDGLLTMKSHSILMTKDIVNSSTKKVLLDEGRDERKNNNCNTYGNTW